MLAWLHAVLSPFSFQTTAPRLQTVSVGVVCLCELQTRGDLQKCVKMRRFADFLRLANNFLQRSATSALLLFLAVHFNECCCHSAALTTGFACFGFPANTQ